MAATNGTPAFKLGDRVKIRHFGFPGKIVELRGPLAPGGVQVYRVKYRRKPSPRYIEVREDQLTLLPAKAATQKPSESAGSGAEANQDA
jgi:hypothetical protein